MVDLSKPPPRGSFGDLLGGTPPKPRPPAAPPPEPIQPPPPLHTGGGRQRTHITIELVPTVARRPQRSASLFWLLFWFALALILLAHA
jgi:hypothetical protein